LKLFDTDEIMLCTARVETLSSSFLNHIAKNDKQLSNHWLFKYLTFTQNLPEKAENKS